MFVINQICPGLKRVGKLGAIGLYFFKPVTCDQNYTVCKITLDQKVIQKRIRLILLVVYDLMSFLTFGNPLIEPAGDTCDRDYRYLHLITS